jgi:hypothetical protein
MPHLYCPCGYRLDRSSDGRSLKSPLLRLFISIRWMTSVTIDDKICNACRGSYYTWRKKNGEFDAVFSLIEENFPDDDDDNVHSVRLLSILLLNRRYRCFLRR